MTKVFEPHEICKNFSLEDMPGEVWEDVGIAPSCQFGFYKVSNYGRVKSLERFVNHPEGGVAKKVGKILSQGVSKYGYLLVLLHFNGVKTNYRVHRLVAFCFLGAHSELNAVNHKDGNKSNNVVENLEWVTAKENSQHAVLNNLFKQPLGSNRPNSKISESDVVEILEMLQNGVSSKEIANKFSIGVGQISSIKRNRTWKHVARKFEFPLCIGEQHFLSKLTNLDVVEIHNLLENGKCSQYEIAKKFNVAQSVISRIKTGARWAHLKDGLSIPNG